MEEFCFSKDEDLLNTNQNDISNFRINDNTYVNCINIFKRGKSSYLFYKRLFDILASFLGLILLSPLMFLIGIIVKCSSKGPIIYKSIRVGQYGKTFMMYKFRSMYFDADIRLTELIGNNEIQDGITFKIKDDPRITKFGKFIRKTSMDELPQLFNILIGNISIIGPRPALPTEVDKYSETQKLRLLVPQGLSGEWQTHGRSKTSFKDMIKMDLEYSLYKRGFWYDIGLIFLTVYTVIKKDGAE